MKKVSIRMLPFSFAIVFLFPTAAPTATILPFIPDNYSKALSEARQRNLPLFVEVWAPW